MITVYVQIFFKGVFDNSPFTHHVTNYFDKSGLLCKSGHIYLLIKGCGLYKV